MTRTLQNIGSEKAKGGTPYSWSNSWIKMCKGLRSKAGLQKHQTSVFHEKSQSAVAVFLYYPQHIEKRKTAASTDTRCPFDHGEPRRWVPARGRRDESSPVKNAQPAERSTVPGVRSWSAADWVSFSWTWNPWKFVILSHSIFSWDIVSSMFCKKNIFCKRWIHPLLYGLMISVLPHDALIQHTAERILGK